MTPKSDKVSLVTTIRPTCEAKITQMIFFAQTNGGFPVQYTPMTIRDAFCQVANFHFKQSDSFRSDQVFVFPLFVSNLFWLVPGKKPTWSMLEHTRLSCVSSKRFVFSITISILSSPRALYSHHRCPKRAQRY